MTLSQQRIKAICEQRKLPIYAAEAALGFSNGYLMHERAKDFPYDRLAKIAEYLGVSVDVLTDTVKADNSAIGLSAEEWDVITRYRLADDYDKGTIQHILSRYK